MAVHKYDHRIKNKKYIGLIMGCGVVEKRLEMATPTK